ncbi:MAG TPA: HAD hydrolase family protein [Chitinophagales bacterium]|nr:HAD hydrolase family protein [Chitinophagales bacterium]
MSLDYSPVKLVLSDVDGVLTDGGLYFTESGDQFKKFHVHDGMGFLLLKKAGIKTGIITSENLELVRLRAQRIQPDHLYMGVGFEEKLHTARAIARQEGISLDEVAYIGDDVNCIALLEKVGFPTCPADAVDAVKNIPGIFQTTRKGGEGAFRELADKILSF